MRLLTNGIQLAPGCYLDSNRGWRIVGHAIELAIDLGYEPSEPMDDLLATFYNEPADLDRIDSAIDRIYWEVDRAVDWLTDNLTGDEPDRYWWGFEDGDFGLWEKHDLAA